MRPLSGDKRRLNFIWILPALVYGVGLWVNNGPGYLVLGLVVAVGFIWLTTRHAKRH